MLVVAVAKIIIAGYGHATWGPCRLPVETLPITTDLAPAKLEQCHYYEDSLHLVQ